MTYVIPQVNVFQEFTLAPTTANRPLQAHIAGGNAQLIRYSVPTEKPLGALGSYDPNLAVAYNYPDRPAGAIVDHTYTKLFIDDALLRYYSSSNPDFGDTMTSVAGYSNRVASVATGFAVNGATYPHVAAAFLDRGVRLGDVARVRATVAGTQYELCSYVAGFAANRISAIIGDITRGDNNQLVSTASHSISKSGGPPNCVSAVIGVASTYNGLAAGKPEEVYTVRVVESSIGGNAATALLRATTDSGTDDVFEFSPAAFGQPTTIGTRGVEVLFSVSSDSLSISLSGESREKCASAAAEAGVSSHDLVVGQEWRIVVTQAFTVPVVTVAGTYIGKSDDTYIIEVVRGTAAGVAPQFSVRTVRGLDVSAPVSVLSSAVGVFYPVGTQGLTVHFNSTNLAKGDRWYVPVTTAAGGANNTLILGHNLPEAVIAHGPTAVIVDFYIRKNIQVSANRVGFAPETNWDQSATQLTVNPGITAYDASWTDNGVPQPLVVDTRCGYAQLFVETRYWLTALSAKVTAVTDTQALDTLIPGPLHPDNPLKYGIFKALTNSNGTVVLATAVCDPTDIKQWITVLALLDGRSGPYGLVPLTRDPAVQALYEEHVLNQSSPADGLWRGAWLNQAAVLQKAIVDPATSKDKAVVLAVIEDDPLAAGTQFTLLRVPSRNANFVANGVQAGDIVRYKFTTDGFGGATYDELIIDAVVNEDTLRLQTGLDASVSVGERMEVWRTLSTQAQAEELAKLGGIHDRRIKVVWPDTITSSDGLEVPGYFVCAALAGEASGIAPQQGMTHLELAGFAATPRTDAFSGSQLNIMAAGGMWIVAQNPRTGVIYTRHAVTSSAITDDVAEREEMVTRNVDSMSFIFLGVLAPYIGVANVATSAMALIQAELNGAIGFLTSSNFSPQLGSQLIAGNVVSIARSLIQRDRIIVVMALTVPSPLNNIDLILQISV